MPVLWPGWPFCLVVPSKRQGSAAIQTAQVSRILNFDIASRPMLQAQLRCSGQDHRLPPKGRLFSLSETRTMERYIHDSLVAGIIQPSSSPAGAGFFFVGKKDKSLRPCIDYRGLNDITIKNRYPLPHISSAFELLEEVTCHLF